MILSQGRFWGRVLSLAAKKGLSQPMLATEIAVSVNTLKTWIYQGKFPPLPVALTLADYFGVSIDWLCGKLPLTDEGIHVAKKFDEEKNSEIKNAVKTLLHLT